MAGRCRLKRSDKVVSCAWGIPTRTDLCLISQFVPWVPQCQWQRTTLMMGSGRGGGPGDSDRGSLFGPSPRPNKVPTHHYVNRFVRRRVTGSRV